MKLLSVFIFCITISIHSYAQDEFVKVVCGYSVTDSQLIYCNQRSFAETIFDIDELPDEKQLVLALKETKNKNVLGDRGYLLSVNLGSGKTVWEKKIGNFDITFTQDYIVYKSFDGYKIF